MSFAIPRRDSADWGIDYGRRDVFLGVGSEASFILEQFLSLKKHAMTSVSLGSQARLKNEIEELRERYSQPNWDGDDAEPISLIAASSASSFVNMLPDNIFEPDLTPEKSGTISFDWNRGKDQIFSVSATSDRLIFAGILGGERTHGDIPCSNEIPDQIRQILTRYFSRT